MSLLTIAKVKKSVKDLAKEVKREFQGGYFKKDTDREELIEWLDESCDSLWGNLVMQGRLDKYDVDDLTRTAHDCAVILKVAQDENCVETDSGLWEGLQYGILASMAYSSLRNLAYYALKNVGIDSNEDHPFENIRQRKQKVQ
jgi:hypothetical protein